MKINFYSKFYQKLLLTSLLLILIVNTTDSQAYKVRMAMMGNSITYGAGLTNPSTECYPAQLSLMLSAIYGDTCEIMNYGVSGRTMMRSAENPIWNESQFLSALKYVPDICLILLGTNDSKPYRWESWGDEFLSDYLTMIDTFKFRNPYTRFIVCFPPPIWEGHPYGTTFENSHNDSVLVNCIIPIIDTVAKMTGATLIDFHTPFIDSLNLFPDKLHPNAQGSKIMAEILYNKIIETDLIHQVEPGLAFVSSFNQSISPVAVGSSVVLRWTTIYADSVFLNGIPVDLSGSIEVIAEENKVYTLTAKGSKNTSDYTLNLNSYTPEKSGLVISTLSLDYANGKPVVLYIDYTDQNGKKMDENTSNITWSVAEGQGQFGDQTDTSIVFIPVATGKVVIQAQEGELSVQKTLTVNTITSAYYPINSEKIKVFPNPVNGTLFFQIENQSYKNIRINIYNLLGEQLLVRDFDIADQGITDFELNTSDLKKGIYVYAIHFDNEVIFGQFVKYVEN